jgi:hypothetical protein
VIPSLFCKVWTHVQVWIFKTIIAWDKKKISWMDPHLVPISAHHLHILLRPTFSLILLTRDSMGRQNMEVGGSDME